MVERQENLGPFLIFIFFPTFFLKSSHLIPSHTSTISTLQSLLPRKSKHRGLGVVKGEGDEGLGEGMGTVGRGWVGMGRHLGVGAGWTEGWGRVGGMEIERMLRGN